MDIKSLKIKNKTTYVINDNNISYIIYKKDNK